MANFTWEFNMAGWKPLDDGGFSIGSITGGYCWVVCSY
jgi:hypothetical protein